MAGAQRADKRQGYREVARGIYPVAGTDITDDRGKAVPGIPPAFPRRAERPEELFARTIDSRPQAGAAEVKLPAHRAGLAERSRSSPQKDEGNLSLQSLVDELRDVIFPLVEDHAQHMAAVLDDLFLTLCTTGHLVLSASTTITTPSAFLNMAKPSDEVVAGGESIRIRSKRSFRASQSSSKLEESKTFGPEFELREMRLTKRFDVPTR